MTAVSSIPPPLLCLPSPLDPWDPPTLNLPNLQEGYKAVAYTVDMSRKEDIYKAAILTKEQVGTVTILVNNAGIVSGSPILDTPDERIIKTFEVDSFSHLWTIKAF